jgi:nitrite reductase/ring-hydroxylating ferredoxin subunit
VKVKGSDIALFNVEGNYYAIANSCPHSTGPLVEGRLTKNIITCPWHGSQFDITNGQCYSGPATTDVTHYATYIEDNAIFIEIT